MFCHSLMYKSIASSLSMSIWALSGPQNSHLLNWVIDFLSKLRASCHSPSSQFPKPDTMQRSYFSTASSSAPTRTYDFSLAPLLWLPCLSRPCLSLNLISIYRLQHTLLTGLGWDSQIFYLPPQEELSKI